MKTTDALIVIDHIEGNPVTADMLCLALLEDMGCHCSGYDIKSKDEGNYDYSGRIEWFDPYKVISMDDYLALPEHWQVLFRNQNNECWRCGYRYVHVPNEILCQYPHTPLKGLFVVVNGDATPENVKGDDLIHSGGQFVEYDRKDKGLWIQQIEENAENELVIKNEEIQPV